MTRRFTKLLVANRGEIAVRIVRGAQALGYPCVAVYSTADAGAPHVALAEEAVEIGPPPARESYLCVERLIAAARRTGADAVHPGYGFLSESAAFASVCAEAGLQFVGPGSEAIAIMGDKARARAAMEAAGVPCVPGYHGAAQDLDALQEAAVRIGFPLLVKAAAGGGGRGMRTVHRLDDLAAALVAARSEAESAFGVGALILERLVVDARHVEIQVLADAHGHTLHLGERDCSAQRRFQKVIEECPSPAVDTALRQRMGAAAVAAARAVGYEGVGTVELLLEASGAFYFLEMNTRLQVEHPVTECVTGLDLVALQLAVAAGEPLPFTQEQVTFTGHAIEARLYAEDPYDGHRPKAGRIVAFEPPVGPGLRCDHGLVPGLEVTAWYDPMLGKLIAHGRSREEARRRLVRGLTEAVLLGTVTNTPFLIDVLEHPVFMAGGVTTRFLEAPGQAGLTERPFIDPETVALAAMLWTHRDALLAEASVLGAGSTPVPLSVDGGDPLEPRVRALGPATYEVTFAGTARAIAVVGWALPRVRVVVDGRQLTVHAAWSQGALFLGRGGHQIVCREHRRRAAAATARGTGTLRAQITGSVVSVGVAVNDRVARGDVAVVLEAMKIQSPVLCDLDGTVTSVGVAVGDQVSAGRVLVVIEPDEPAT